MEQSLERYAVYLAAERNASRYTLRNYLSEVGEAMAFFREQGFDAWHQVDRRAVQAYLARLYELGYTRASVARRVSELRAFGQFIQRQRLSERNPFGSLRAPKVEERLPSFLSPDDVARLLGAPPQDNKYGLRDRSILETLYASGVRVAELAALDLEEIDDDTGALLVRGKGSRQRVALLGKAAVVALRDYLDMARPLLSDRRRPSRAVYLNRLGGRLTERSIQTTVAKYARAVGITRATPHVLRHTFATHMLDGGADLRVIQELLGHAQLTTTQRYTHVTQAHMRAVYEAAHPRAGSAASEPAQPPVARRTSAEQARRRAAALQTNSTGEPT